MVVYQRTMTNGIGVATMGVRVVREGAGAARAGRGGDEGRRCRAHDERARTRGVITDGAVVMADAQARRVFPRLAAVRLTVARRATNGHSYKPPDVQTYGCTNRPPVATSNERATCQSRPSHTRDAYGSLGVIARRAPPAGRARRR